MNEHELDLALHDLGELHVRREAPLDLRQSLRAVPVETTQQQSWLPHIDTGGFTMFSALKFIAAGVIVALFGGFLVAGVFTTQHGDEVVPAAVTASPSPEDLAASHPVGGQLLHDHTYQDGDESWDGEALVRSVRGQGIRKMLVMDDPRLDGWLWITVNEDAFRAASSSLVDLGSVRSGTVELVNERGSWVGTFYGYTTGVHPSAEVTPPERVHRHFQLSGTGAYTGLSALLDSDGLRGQPQPHDVQGLVFPGSLPEYPDPVEVPDE